MVKPSDTYRVSALQKQRPQGKDNCSHYQNIKLSFIQFRNLLPLQNIQPYTSPSGVVYWACNHWYDCTPATVQRRHCFNRLACQKREKQEETCSALPGKLTTLKNTQGSQLSGMIEIWPLQSRFLFSYSYTSLYFVSSRPQLWAWPYQAYHENSKTKMMDSFSRAASWH